MTLTKDSTQAIWVAQTDQGPLVATAIHNGHSVREEVAEHLALEESARLREEDPFTADWTAIAPTRVVGTRSRFEVDLNRPREQAVYRTPMDAWGLMVWNGEPSEAMFERSLDEYDDFYQGMTELLDEKRKAHGRFVVFDLHSYNHRRAGPDGPAADPQMNPQVNVGTGTMDRRRWGPVVDAFIEKLRAFDFPGGRLDVRENVKFQGGQWPRWIHHTYPESGVALAIELKKFFMDEWTAHPDHTLIEAIRDALESTIPDVLAALKRA